MAASCTQPGTASRRRRRLGVAALYSRHMDTQVTKDSNVAAIVAGLVLPFAIYVAFWQIHWTQDGDSLLPHILPFFFCIIVSSVIGSIVAGIVKAVKPT
jgi:hypothetical protein